MFDLKADLERRKREGLYRRPVIADSPQGAVMRIDGREVLSFCSNDYLGLANHPQVRAAFIDAVERFGVGSGAAHLVNGHSRLHDECECMLAEFTGRDRALLFSTGYMANLAIASALLGRHDFIYQDRLNHASLIDSARLSGARLRRYRHNDLIQLEQMLQERDGNQQRCMVMSDGVFSMDGDRADIVGLARICSTHQCELMIDDAHGFGVLGANGAGLCEEQGLDQQQVPVLMATLGKAVGVSGAFVAGNDDLIETLIQQGRSYIFTTASPPAIAAAVMQALRIIRTEAWRREKLYELIHYFRQRASGLDCELMPSTSAIQPIVIGDNQRAVDLGHALLERGIHVTPIRPPTVPEHTARLRITLSAGHEKVHIDRLIDCLSELLA